MKKIWGLAALGLIAFIAFALITLPASVVANRLASLGIVTAGVTGTAWNGSAQVVQIAGANVGALTWKLRVLPLFLARAEAAIRLTRTDGFAQGNVAATASRVRLTDFTAALPIGTLPPQVAPGGWTGNINAKFAELTIDNGWPASATGTVEVMDLVGPARQPSSIGSYRVTFPAEAQVAGALTGALSDIAGPIQIAGTLQLKAADRSYLIDGMVATKPDAPPDFVRSLEFLGPPDDQGRRPFSVSGTM